MSGGGGAGGAVATGAELDVELVVRRGAVLGVDQAFEAMRRCDDQQHVGLRRRLERLEQGWLWIAARDDQCAGAGPAERQHARFAAERRGDQLRDAGVATGEVLAQRARHAVLLAERARAIVELDQALHDQP
jgi:hypothetical protein